MNERLVPIKQRKIYRQKREEVNSMPKKKKTSKAQKAQVKVRDLKAKKDARGGLGFIKFSVAQK